MLIEKGYAKFKHSYEAIDGGVDRYAMVDLTGASASLQHVLH